MGLIFLIADPDFTPMCEGNMVHNDDIEMEPDFESCEGEHLSYFCPICGWVKKFHFKTGEEVTESD